MPDMRPKKLFSVSKMLICSEYRPNKPKNGGITAGIPRAGRGRDAIGNGVDSSAEVSFSEAIQRYVLRPGEVILQAIARPSCQVVPPSSRWCAYWQGSQGEELTWARFAPAPKEHSLFWLQLLLFCLTSI